MYKKKMFIYFRTKYLQEKIFLMFINFGKKNTIYILKSVNKKMCTKNLIFNKSQF